MHGLQVFDAPPESYLSPEGYPAPRTQDASPAVRAFGQNFSRVGGSGVGVFLIWLGEIFFNGRQLRECSSDFGETLGTGSRTCTYRQRELPDLAVPKCANRF